jgi:1,4-alpha-glucan branching enzyme
MTQPSQNNVSGYLSITLHAHLPYVVNHGTWPHGLEWLLEAAAETYLPLLRMLRGLQRDGIFLNLDMDVSPVLLEQLAHPVFREEFPRYMQRKVQAAREDEAYFGQNGDAHYAELARYWGQTFGQTLADFQAMDGDIVRGLREAQQDGLLEIITCAATHGYLPLLGTDESVSAQVRTGVATHERHLGRKPRGIWLPECAYRPAGPWQTPVPPEGSDRPWDAFQRKGVEEVLGESGIDFFHVDTHLVESSIMYTPYELRAGGPLGVAAALEMETGAPHRSLYRPYYVEGPQAHQHPVAIFPRDPRTGLQVWSGESGYPGDSNYLDFHKKRWPGGHRYWQVTHPKIDMAYKTPYHPEKAAARARAHAEHFVGLVYDALKPGLGGPTPPVLSAPFDAELFGHWWYEGALWLEQVARVLAENTPAIRTITGAGYLDKFPVSGYLALEEGSWGKNGTHEVWLNPDTRWTWKAIYPAEAAVREAASAPQWRGHPLGERIVKQLCRELLLLESSDWQFLITTESARDYAEKRFTGHLESFHALEQAWGQFLATGSITGEQESKLAQIEKQDSLFAHIDPSLWARRA